MITDNEISFVVQGALDKRKYKNSFVTQEVVNSIRKFYPSSEIILSTWVNQYIEVENCDKIVLSEDPGGYLSNGVHLNVNRQIVSSLNGVRESTRVYSAKLRSDLLVVNDGMLRCLNYLNNNYRRTSDAVFEGWIACLNLTSINMERHPRALAICDWIYAGKTEDIQSLFDIQLYPEEYFEFYKEKKCIKDDCSRQRYNAEQWILFQSLANKNDKLKNFFYDGWVDSEYIKFVHSALLANDICIFNKWQLGVKSTKYRLQFFALEKMMTHKDWVRNYVRYHNQNEKKLNIDSERYLYNILSNNFVRSLGKKIVGR